MIEYIDKTWEDAALAGWEGPGWYFWDETEANCYGPYETKEKAEQALDEYIDAYLGGRIE